MQLGATEAEGEDVSKALRIAMRNGVSLIPRDSLPNAKWRIALGNASQVANEKVTPNRCRCTVPGNRDSVEAQPARASALRTGAHHSPVQLFITTRAPCRSVIRVAGQRATAAR